MAGAGEGVVIEGESAVGDAEVVGDVALFDAPAAAMTCVVFLARAQSSIFNEELQLTIAVASGTLSFGASLLALGGYQMMKDAGLLKDVSGKFGAKHLRMFTFIHGDVFSVLALAPGTAVGIAFVVGEGEPGPAPSSSREV